MPQKAQRQGARTGHVLRVVARVLKIKIKIIRVAWSLLISLLMASRFYLSL